jgi:hypothetical protein
MEETVDTSGFYKFDNGAWLYAPNFVYSPTYSLVRENRDNYNYPVDGWIWYNEKPE